MAKSKFDIGDLEVIALNLGDNDVKAHLGDTLLYPLSKPIDNAVVTCASATYNGSNQVAQDITVTLSGVTLVENTDYTITQNTGGTNAGSYTVTVSGMGDYESTASGTFTINKVTPTVTAPTPLPNVVYDGTAQVLINRGSTDYGLLMYSINGVVWASGEPGATDAGDYTIYYKVNGDSNVNDVAQQSIVATINKVTPTVVAPTPKVLTYNGSAQELANAGSTDFGTLKYKVGSDSWSTSVPTRTRSGSYELYYKVDGDSNVYDVPSASTTCSINEKQVTATVTLSQTTYTYNGSACQPTPTVKDGTTVIDPSEYTVTYSNNVNAGTATVTISDNAGGDYEVIGSATFTINKADPTYTAPTEKTGLVYNTSDQALLNAGSATGGTIYYSSDGSTWGTAIPSGTNATSYTSYWKITGDANHNDKASASIATSIAKVTPTVTAPTAKTGLVYSGAAQALATAGSTNYGTLQYSLDNTSYSTSIPSGTNATSYTVYYKVVGNSNVNDVAANSISVSIAKADTTYTAPTANNRTYDTTSKALLNAGAVTGGTLYYSSDNSTWSTTIPTQTNAGSYTTYWKITGDSNHNDKASASISTTVSAKTVSSPTITLSQDSYVYNNTARQPGATVKDGTVTIASSEYTVSYSNNTNVGTATCTITDKTGGNYTVSGSKTFTITCTSCTAPTAKSLTYNGSAQALVNAGSTSFGTMVYSTDNSTWGTSVPSGTNATSYTVYWKVTGNTNVCCTASSSVACSIAKAAMTYTAPSAATRTYNGSVQQIVSGQSAGGGSIYFATSSAGASSSTTVPTQTNAGTYSTYWKAVPDSNHSGGTSSWAQVSSCKINPQSISNVTITFNTDSFTYNNSVQKPSTVTVKSGTSALTVNTHYTLTYSNSSSTNVGTYTISASPTSNYSFTTVSKNYTIGCYTATAPTAKSLTYNGSAQALVNAGSTSYGTMVYSTSSTGTFTTSIPSGTNAGSYEVWWKVTGNTNVCNTAATKINSTISPKTVNSPTITLSPTAYTYNGSACQPTPTVKDGSTMIASSEYTVSYSNNVNAGTATCTITDKSGGNYTVSGSKTFTINKANSSLSFAVTSITVGTGETETNAVTVNAGDGTVTYSSNNTTAVTVNNSGTITGVGAGYAIITANISSTSNYNSASTSYTASCVAIVTAKFNVTDTTNPTNIANNAFSLAKIVIDGVEQQRVITEYTFSTTGEHTVKYYLNGTSIGDSFFSGCTNLTSIDIPDNVTDIGISAFTLCTGLTSINIPSGITSISNAAFSGCWSLTSVTIPSGVTLIGVNGFSGCRSLTSVTIPDTVTFINTYGFYGCSGLTSVTIPSSVTRINSYAFAYCSGLTRVTVNATTPPTLEDTAFNYTNVCPFYVPCDSVDTYKAASGWSKYASRIEGFGCPLVAKFNVTDTSSPTRIASETTNVTKIVIDGVTQQSITTGYTFSTTGEHTVKYYLNNNSIGYNAFTNCSGLTSITIPNDFTNINEYAFSGCKGLTSCTIGSGVTRIRYQAFNACTSLTSIVIPDSVTIIEDRVFWQCSGLTSIVIPDSVTSIGNSVFSNCSGLTSCTIGSGVTSIGNQAFYCCYNLSVCTIGNSVTSIGEKAFDACYSLTSITIPSSVTSIGNGAFSSCSGFTSIVIPDSVTSIGYSAFSYCYSLTSIDIPSGVTSIGKKTFYRCFHLTSITISNSVTSIGDNAFYDCSSLTSIVIPSGVTSIDEDAFYDCSSLTSITVNATTPPTLSIYGVFVGTNDCPIYVPSGSVDTYKAASGWSDYASRIQAIP